MKSVSARISELCCFVCQRPYFRNLICRLRSGKCFFLYGFQEKAARIKSSENNRLSCCQNKTKMMSQLWQFILVGMFNGQDLTSLTEMTRLLFTGILNKITCWLR